MQNASTSNARNNDRRRQLKAGIILFNGRHSTLPCSVKDISETGARIEADAASVPDTFILHIELGGLEAPCEVVWRKVNFIGVRFTEPPKQVGQRRAQVVNAVGPTSLPTLRRKKPV